QNQFHSAKGLTAIAPLSIDRVSKEEINWHFSLPSGPHFGWFWEASVPSIGLFPLNFNDFVIGLTHRSKCTKPIRWNDGPDKSSILHLGRETRMCCRISFQC
ncbi:hypothetical protein ILUMI_16655, partial [Ignelater luminosus]